MLLDKEINFAEILLLLMECMKREDKVINQQEVNKFIEKIVVRDFAPLKEKQISIMRIISGLENQSIIDVRQRPDEVALIVERLTILEEINLYTNIYVDPTLDLDIFTIDIYDVFYQSGIMDSILEICGSDENIFRNMIRDALNWSNIFNLFTTAEKFNSNRIDELINEIRNLKHDMSEESIKKLHDIAEITNPMRSTIGDAVSIAFMDTIDKISNADANSKINTNDPIIELDNVLTENMKNDISKNIREYFKGKIDEREIEDAYKYLKDKNAENFNKINIEIDEEKKKMLSDGMTAQMIKLISKKQDLENKYKKQEELLRLADNMMSLNEKNIDEIDNFIKSLQIKK